MKSKNLRRLYYADSNTPNSTFFTVFPCTKLHNLISILFKQRTKPSFTTPQVSIKASLLFIRAPFYYL